MAGCCSGAIDGAGPTGLLVIVIGPAVLFDHKVKGDIFLFLTKISESSNCEGAIPTESKVKWLDEEKVDLEVVPGVRTFTTRIIKK